MTGRELIVYILEHNLENESIIKDGRFVGLLTLDEAAAKLEVGKATVKAKIQDGVIEGTYVEEGAYVFDNIK